MQSAVHMNGPQKTAILVVPRVVQNCRQFSLNPRRLVCSLNYANSRSHAGAPLSHSAFEPSQWLLSPSIGYQLRDRLRERFKEVVCCLHHVLHRQ